MIDIKIQEDYDNKTINIALDTINKNKQALIFVNSKRSAEKTAEDISKKIKKSSPELEILSRSVLKVLSRPTVQCERLARCIRKGIAFHHAGLRSEQKELIENAFRDGKIKIIACTPTLAAGVDLPAFRAILQNLRRYSGFGLNWIPVLEYLQMSGRAGRPGYDDYGEAIAIASTDAARDEIENRYINGVPENIYSKLAVEPVLRTYLLSLIATGFVKTKKQILDFFSKTFWAYQYADLEKLHAIIEKMLKLLEDYKFIKSNQEEFMSASDLDDAFYVATLLGRRVSEVYIDPLTAHHFVTCLNKVPSIQLTSMSFLQMICHTLEMRPLLTVKTAEFDDIQEKLNLHFSNLIDTEPSLYDPDYDTYLCSVKTALFLNDWVDENDEQVLLDKYNVRPGEIRVKIDTADWLLYASEEIAKVQNMQNILKEIIKLRFRLKYGVREELLPLLRLKGIGRVRARKLYANHIRNLGDVKKCDINKLATLIGSRLTLDIKQQVGVDVSNVQIKRCNEKGQINLTNF